jgi:energy-coupling factor transport system permease protein
MLVDVVDYVVFFGGAAVPVFIAFGVVGLAGFREITRFERSGGFYYRLNPATKITALVLVAVSSAMASPDLGFAATLVILGSYLTLKSGSRKLEMALFFTVAIVWATAWEPVSFLLQREVAGALLQGPGFSASFLPDVYRLVLRQFAVSGVFLMALILVMTSTPSDVMRSLRRVGVPNPITFSLVVGMRTVPLLLGTIDSTVKVQLMRGFGSRASRPLGPLYVFAAAMLALIPSLIFLLRGARNTAISTGTRAFGAFKSRTYVKEPRYGRADAVVLAFCFALLAASASY